MAFALSSWVCNSSWLVGMARETAAAAPPNPAPAPAPAAPPMMELPRVVLSSLLPSRSRLGVTAAALGLGELYAGG